MNVCYAYYWGRENPQGRIDHNRYKLSFPGRSMVNNPLANAGDAGLIPKSRISPEEGNGKPFHYSCLKNSMDRGAWWATVHGITKLDMTEQNT